MTHEKKWQQLENKREEQTLRDLKNGAIKVKGRKTHANPR